MVVKGTVRPQHVARKHARDEALSPRVASTGLSKPRGKQLKAHQRTRTQRTTTRPTRTRQQKGQNHTISTKGMKGKPNETNRSKKDTAATALSSQVRPQPNNPKKNLMQSTSPSKAAVPTVHVPDLSCDDEIRDDEPSLASPPKADGRETLSDIQAPEPAQSSTSTSAAFPTDSKQNNAFHFASTLIEELVDSCTEDIGAIKAVFDTLTPKAIAMDNSDSSVHAKKPVPATLAPPIAKELAPIVKRSVSHTCTHRRHHSFPAQSHVVRPIVGSSGGHHENDVDPLKKQMTDTEKADPAITNAQPSTLSCAEPMATPPEVSRGSSSSPSKKNPKIFSRLDKRQKGKKKKNGNEKRSSNHIKQDGTGEEPSDIAVQGEIKENVERPAPKKPSDEHKNPTDLVDSSLSFGYNLKATPKKPDGKTTNEPIPTLQQSEDINLDSSDEADTSTTSTTMMDTKNQPPLRNAANINACTVQDDLPEKYSSPETTSETDLCDDEQDDGDKKEDTAQRKLKALPLKTPVSLSPTKTLSAIKANSKKRHVSFSPSIDANETAKKSVKASCSFSVPRDFEDLVEKLMCRADEALCVCSIAEYVEDIFEGKDTSSIHADDLSESSEEASVDAILRADTQTSSQTTDKQHDDFDGPRPSNDDNSTAGDISQKLDDISSSKGKDVGAEDEESIIPDDLSLTVMPKSWPNENVSGKAADLPVIDENDADDYPSTTKNSTGPAAKFRFGWKNKSKGRGKSSATSIGGSAEGLPSKEASTSPSEYKEADYLSVTKRYRTESNVTPSDSEDTSTVVEGDSKCGSSSSGTEACSEGDFDVEESESGNGSDKKTKVKQCHDVMTRFRLGRRTSRVTSSAMSAACSTDSGSLPSNE